MGSVQECTPLKDVLMTRPMRFKVPALWRNPNYMLIWGGQTLSALGSSVSGIAFPLFILALTHSPAQAGIAGALRAVPYVLLSIPAGALVDRWNLRAVMLACDSGRAVVLGSIPVTLWAGYLSVGQLYIAATMEGTLFVFYNIASFAALPHIVPKDDIPAAVAQNEASYYAAAGLLGSTAGGAFYQIGHAVPFAVDAISYIVSVLSLLRVRIPQRSKRTESPLPLWIDMRGGLRWMWHQPLIRSMSVVYGADALVSPGGSLILIVIAEHQHTSPVAIGAIFSIGAVGGILGSAIAGRVHYWLSFSQTIIGVRWAVVPFWALYATAPNAVLLGAVTAVIYFLNPIGNVVGMSYSIPLIPEEMRGRAASIFQIIPSAGTPVGLALTGLLLQAWGAERVVLTEAVFLLGLAIATALNTHIRNAPPQPILRSL